MVKKVAVINDLSGLGKCSLTAAIPVLSVLGVQPCPIPTAILTNQTGYDSYYCDDYTNKMDYYTEEWKKRNLVLDGIYSGFLGSAAQADKILNFCDIFCKKDTLFLVDPVLGDSGKAYPIYTTELREKMKTLVHRANIITPNLTECCLLTQTDYDTLTSRQHSTDYLKHIAQMGHLLLDENTHTVIITGIIWQSPNDTAPCYYNLVLERDSTIAASSGMYGGSYSGTGDLLSSVMCASLVRGDSSSVALNRAMHFLEAALKNTVEEHIPRNDGVNFEPFLPLLLEPAPKDICIRL